MSVSDLALSNPTTQAPPSSGLGLASDSLLLNHALNREKQSRNLLARINTPDVQFITSPSKENVNVQCNPGFYDQVIKPAFCTITEGFSFSVNSIILSLSTVVPHLDSTLVEERRMVKFSFLLSGIPSMVTLHFHHTTCNLQVQGSRIMPDLNTSSVWFVKNALYERLTCLSMTKQSDIQAFHNALINLTPTQHRDTNTSSEVESTCGHCHKVFGGRSVLVPCVTCPATLHKTCVRPHKCPGAPLPTPSQKRPAADITSFEVSDDDVDEPPPTLHQQIESLSLPSSLAGSSPIGVPYSSVIPTPPSQTAPQCSVPSIVYSSSLSAHPLTCLPSAPPSIIPLISSSSTCPQIISQPTLSFSNCFTNRPESSAPTSLPLASIGSSSRPRQPAKKSRTAQLSPEAVQIEYLKKEISISQTKITSLESVIREKNDTIKILNDRISVTENPVIAQMFSKYFSDSIPAQSMPPTSVAPTAPPQVQPCSLPQTQTLPESSPLLKNLEHEVGELKILFKELRDFVNSNLSKESTVSSPPSTINESSPDVSQAPCIVVTDAHDVAVQVPEDSNPKKKPKRSPQGFTSLPKRPFLLPTPPRPGVWLPGHEPKSISSNSTWLLPPQQQRLNSRRNFRPRSVPTPPSRPEPCTAGPSLPSYRPRSATSPSSRPKPSTPGPSLSPVSWTQSAARPEGAPSQPTESVSHSPADSQANAFTETRNIWLSKYQSTHSRCSLPLSAPAPSPFLATRNHWAPNQPPLSSNLNF